MNVESPMLIHTRDPDLAQHLRGWLAELAAPEVSHEAAALARFCARETRGIILLDLRTPEGGPALQTWLARGPRHLWIALGDPHSGPAQQALQSGCHALESLDAEGFRLQQLVAQSARHLTLLYELDSARGADRSAHPAPAPEALPPPASPTGRVLRHFDDVEKLAERLVEDVAASAALARAGLVARIRGRPDFRLLAGLHCLAEADRIACPDADPLPCWLERHGHGVTRATLGRLENPADRTRLQRHLEMLGAEALLPMFARGRLLGWFFAGRHVTGRAFTDADIEHLTTAADHCAAALDNALLYEEAGRQKALAENLLHALPAGIIAVDQDAVVRWFSAAARDLLDLDPAEAIGRPADALGSRMAALVRRALDGEVERFPEAWHDPATGRPLYVQCRRLLQNERCLGAVVILQDLATREALKEKQEQLERTVFWTDLAASMSHEGRNPLVAIKTFAQLLPERYQDPEFREDFSRLVGEEVSRLNGIIDQINEFAHPPGLRFEALDIRQPLQHGLDLALPQGLRDGLRVDTRIAPDLPPVWGDERALSDCFAHLLRNAAEALAGRADAHIGIDARPSEQPRGVRVTVRDNGPGIAPPLRDKVFSPFCTTKPRGMGLGLPIVQRTLIDHNGRVELDTGGDGTAVTISLPALNGSTST